MRLLPILAVVVACPAFFAAVDTTADSPKEVAMSLARKARRAEKAGRVAQAYLFYSEALALSPRNRRYKTKMELLQTRAASQSNPQILPSPGLSGAAAPFPAPVFAPEDIFDSMTAQELAKARDLKSLPSLQAKPGRQDFDLSGDARTLFEQVASRFGLETVFDGDYPRSGARVTFRVADADYREALNDLQAATGSFVVPLSSRLIMVAADTTAKRNDLEQTMEVAIPVPHILTTQELTEMAQIVRQTTNVEKIAWDTTQSQIVIRDRVSRVMPAIGLLQQLMAYRPEVMIELDFLSVAASDMRQYGFTVSNTFSGVYLGKILNNVVTPPSGVTNLLTFGGGKTLIGLTAAQVQAMFSQTSAMANAMYRTQVRSVAGQPATLHVGDKYPVETAGYAGGIPPGQQAQVYAPPPTYRFEDLGFEMKVTPFVHGMGEVTLTLETSFEVLAGQSVNSIPVIDRRSLNSQLRLRAGEWAVIGGLMNTTRSKTSSGFWGPAQVPFFGNLFKQTSTDKEDTDVLIGIRADLLSLPPDQVVSRPLRVGSDARPYVPL
jgi:general secretion pathway protein D